MLNEQTYEKLIVMRLQAMAEAFEELVQRRTIQELSFEECFVLTDRAPGCPASQAATGGVLLLSQLIPSCR